MEKEGNRKPNRLIFEKSPYLLQHAYNPVEWYPWCQDAFEKARREDKLIFLSIGYSTCHWCHVMEKESFEDEEVAKILNERYVPVKVDREERPDIDSIYMTICQAITGSGGWPLTVIITPDNKPVFVGTYFPKKQMSGRPGLIEILTHISNLWRKDKEKLQRNAETITKEIVSYFEKSKNDEKIDVKIIVFACEELKKRYDSVWGGFGSAPKFPTPHILSFLLRYWYRTNEKEVLDMVENTLIKMRLGGIYDHLGGGFHRYSTDNRWLIPHFEKMLYDQALLTIVYTEAYLITKNKFYKQVVEEILTYILRDMTSSDGGFYSAEDADSEGEEGKFYLWSIEEIEKTIGEEEAAIFIKTFNLSKDGNFSSYHTSKGKNILYLVEPLPDEIAPKINCIKEKLFEIRKKRIPPFKDDKVLTDWNGLMIAGLSIASRYLDKPLYSEAAEKAARFILNNMDNKKGGLLHYYRQGSAKIEGLLDDYSFFVWGLLELYQTTFKTEYLKEAIRLVDYQLEHFWDEKNGGMFFTPDDMEKHLWRDKQLFDGAIPSGNSIALLNLIYLWHITANKKYAEKVQKLLITFSSEIKRYPPAYAQFLLGIDFAFNNFCEIVIVGKKDKETKDMITTLNSYYLPDKVVLFKDVDNSQELIKISPYVEKMEMIENRATAYVCKNFVCNLPATNIQQILSMLEK